MRSTTLLDPPTVRTANSLCADATVPTFSPCSGPPVCFQARAKLPRPESVHGRFAVGPDWPGGPPRLLLVPDRSGDLARVHTTLVRPNAIWKAHRVAQRLTSSDPSNTRWQRDLSVSHHKLGLAVAQGKL